MKFRRLIIALAFCSQLAMAKPTCQETCLKAAEAAAKQCQTLAPGQVGACLANVGRTLQTCLKGCG